MKCDRCLNELTGLLITTVTAKRTQVATEEKPYYKMTTNSYKQMHLRCYTEQLSENIMDHIETMVEDGQQEDAKNNLRYALEMSKW